MASSYMERDRKGRLQNIKLIIPFGIDAQKTGKPSIPVDAAIDLLENT